MLSEFLIAFSLITSPAAPSNLEYLKPFLLEVGYSLELLDKRDGWVDSDENPISGDTLLEELRGRWKDYKDFPFSWEEKRWSMTEKQLTDWLSANAAYKSQLEMIQSVRPSLAVSAELERTQFLYNILYCLHTTKTEWRAILDKREALWQLRHLMGDYDFYAGRIYPFIPN